MKKEIKDYIDNAPLDGRTYLLEVYEIAKEVLPEMEEKIAWKMPSFYDGTTPVFQFAAFEKHLGIYPGPTAIEKFADQLVDYKTSKGAIQFQYKEELPSELIRDIAKRCKGNR